MGLWRRILSSGTLCVLVQLGRTQSLEAVVSPRLSSVLIRVNGEEKEVPRDGTLEVLRGDEITLLFAKLEKSTRGPDSINLVGFWRSDVKTRSGDDRDMAIDTNKLRKEWSLDRKGKEYRIDTKSAGVSHGSVRLSVIQPKLEKLELMINNGLHTLGQGDSFEMKASDAIQVKAIHTNIPRLDQEARIVFKDGAVANGRKQVDLQLWHRSYRFAQVTLFLKQE